MRINPRGMLIVTLVTIFIVTSILVGNWFFEMVFGIKFRDAHPFLRSLMHIGGAIIVGWVVVKFFKTN